MNDIRTISSSLEMSQDGIWYNTGSPPPDLSYPVEGNLNCYAVEDRSFWFRHRNNCIVSTVKMHPPKENGMIFDIGGGNGFVSKGLADAGFNVTTVEPGVAGARNAKQRGIKNVICSTIENAKFKPNSLPAVGLFDVIEHIKDDFGFLTTIRELMTKGGLLYVTVPAYSFLWSNVDKASGHFRRFTKKTLSRLLSSTGFELLFSSYIFRPLPIPILLQRTIPYRLGLATTSPITPEKETRGHSTKEGLLSKLLDKMLKPEIDRIYRNRPMWFGGSCLAAAQCR